VRESVATSAPVEEAVHQRVRVDPRREEFLESTAFQR
jgi:hypothetical protein